jgi:hypothetical protein
VIRVGIDNGANGAIVALDAEGRLIRSRLMPILDPGVIRNGKRGTKKILDMRAFADYLCELRDMTKTSPDMQTDDIFVVLEHAQVFPKEGRSTAFTAGRSYGAIEMALVCLSIPYEIVRARKWQTVVLSGIEGDNTKVRSILKCRRRLPELQLLPGKRRKPHDGLADAGCMALYAIELSPGRSRHRSPPRSV